MLDHAQIRSLANDAALDVSSEEAVRSLWIGPHRIIEGDCESALDLLEAGSVDVVVTSPPYNLGIKYSQYEDTLEIDKYLAWIERIASKLERCLSIDGSIFLNVSGSSANPWIAMDVANVFRQFLHLQNNIAWVKSISIGDSTRGHFKPIRSERFLNHNHESIFHFTKSGWVPIDRLAVGVPFQDKSNIARRGHAVDRRCAGDTWFIPYQTIQDRAQRYFHPAAYPIELVQRCLKLHGGRELTVLDPFVGTGTTLVAAHSLGHKGIGIDLDPAYVESSAQRLGELL